MKQIQENQLKEQMRQAQEAQAKAQNQDPHQVVDAEYKILKDK